MRRVRIILWALVAVALAAFAFLSFQPARTPAPQSQPMVMSSIGGPFTLVGSDGKPF
jgi:protein SCO1/2